MQKPKQGKLYCICNQAIATSICDECIKGLTLNPSETFYSPLWLRKLDKYGKEGDIIIIDNPQVLE